MTLIERLEQATGPLSAPDTYELACDISTTLFGVTGVISTVYAAVQDDLNAALALVEEKLPGWTWSVDSARSPCAPTDDGRPQAKVQAPGGRPFGGGAPTPALAVLIALLKALGDQHD
jgi:hypothetical protein